ncbi:uncharacterized protein LOC128726983 [Anopheles nili]|uniref:uncharacterized protein LOC128726983 n=1 Tax=Anopheles nili TaxID=185578 RepID=UPI00237A954C|nr:uncharacterized protein LOC128726983 [Anopheles nili]
MPQILPPEVVQLCRKRPMPPAASPAEPKPFRVNCHGECVLNVTRVLMDRTFRPEQAQKVLLARALNDTIAWTPVIKVAVKKCYMMQVANVFYLTDVAQNRISSQCIPSSRRFLECAFAMIYRDCPEQHWNYNDDRCRDLVTTFNNCDFLFKLVWDI